MSGGDRHLGVGGKKGMEWRGNRVVEELMNREGKSFCTCVSRNLPSSQATTTQEFPASKF